jgi:hypothetical protein
MTFELLLLAALAAALAHEIGKLNIAGNGDPVEHCRHREFSACTKGSIVSMFRMLRAKNNFWRSGEACGG